MLYCSITSLSFSLSKIKYKNKVYLWITMIAHGFFFIFHCTSSCEWPVTIEMIRMIVLEQAHEYKPGIYSYISVKEN